MEEHENVIIFPKWKNDLEHEAKLAMQEHRFKEAYRHFQKLTENGVHSHEVMTGQLICMMELDMQVEAEAFCEELIAKKDRYYAYYVHIYATLLFQMSKYKEVLYLIEDALEKDHLSDPIRGQLEQMYQLSTELQEQEDKKSHLEIEEQLKDALQKRNDRKQWYMVKRLIQLNIQEDKQEFRDMLVNPDIHPVVKTGVLEYFEHTNKQPILHIEKFNLKEEIHINEGMDILPESFVENISTYLESLQHKDPIQFEMAQLILERFIYVYTPFLPQEENYQAFALSLLDYVNKSFQTEAYASEKQAKEKTDYINMIDMSEALYGSILDV